MIKVVVVLPHPEFGGPHNQILQLASPLATNGIRLSAVLPPGPGADRLRSAGVSVETLSLGRARRSWNLRVQARMISRIPLDIIGLVRLFRRSKPDVVQVTSIMNPQAAIAARVLGIPIVWQVLDIGTPIKLRKPLVCIVRLVSAVVMPIGHAIVSAHPGLDKASDKTIVFYPPVDVSRFRPIPRDADTLRSNLGISDDDKVVGMVSNVNPGKGYDVFIDAAAIIRQTCPNVRFLVVGYVYPNHQSYYQSLLSKVASHGLKVGEDIMFLGPRNDIPQVLASMDIFAFTSFSEGTPTVVLEAMASALPVVTSDVGAVREIMVDGQTGFVVPVNDPESVARACLGLLEDANARLQMGSDARKRIVNEFSLEQSLQQHMLAYQLARNRTTPR